MIFLLEFFMNLSFKSQTLRDRDAFHKKFGLRSIARIWIEIQIEFESKSFIHFAKVKKLLCNTVSDQNSARAAHFVKKRDLCNVSSLLCNCRTDSIRN